jgi:hypothetical protein
VFSCWDSAASCYSWLDLLFSYVLVVIWVVICVRRLALWDFLSGSQRFMSGVENALCFLHYQHSALQRCPSARI